MVSAAQLRPIFVVDDDPDVGLLMKHLFRRSGVQNPLRVWTDPVGAMADWAKLIAQRCAQHDLPLLFLIDLKMPRASGMEVIAWLKEQPQLSALPRIVLTASLHNRDVDLAYSAGANGFFSKFPSAFVLAAIARFAAEDGASPAGAPPRFSFAPTA